MPKSRIGIRKKHETFKKKKLKPGHVIKKVNVTDTRFKSKQLSLIEQLQDKHAEVLSYRGLTLGELFKQMGHYNLNVRKDAVIGVKELLKNNPSLITKNLMNIIPSVARLISDPKNDSAMHSQLKLLFSLLFKVSDSQMNPHFSLFVSHALCGLTHIAKHVKLFALEVICMFFKVYPELCVKSPDLFHGFKRFAFGGKKNIKPETIAPAIDLFKVVYKPRKDESEGITCESSLSFEDKTCTPITLVQSKNPFDFPILGSALVLKEVFYLE
uniref:Ipi1_N domain-containing protein n=1 Tax=Strongyloides venezuelensis TaxID=75913 RepID=A0A0K0FVM6_STRVS